FLEQRIRVFIAAARDQVVVKASERGEQNTDVDSRFTGLANIRDLHTQAVSSRGQLAFRGHDQIFPKDAPHFRRRSKGPPTNPEHNIVALRPSEYCKHFAYVDWNGRR